MALEIFRLVGSVFVDTDKAESSLKKTDKDAEGLGTKLVSVATSAGKFAVGVVGAATAAGAAIVAVAENTREYRTEQGKLQAAFETSGFAAGEARSTYEALNSVLGDGGQATEAANHLAKLCTNSEELSSWTNICTGVYATFGASLPIEGLTEAANETAKTGALTGGLADALNWAGVSEEEFQAKLDACNSEQERASLITTTMNGLYTEASDKYKELNADVIAANQAQDRMNNAMASVGAAMEPFVTKGKELLAKVLVRLAPSLEWIANTALPLVGNAVSGVVTWFGNLTGKLNNSGITFNRVMTTAQNVFSGTMEVLGTIWNTVGKPVWDIIKQSVYTVGGAFQQHMPAIKEFVRSAFNDIKVIWQNNLKPALQAVGDFIKNVLAPAFNYVFKSVIEPVVSTVFNTVKKLWAGTLKPVFQGILDFITGVFTLNFKKAFSGLVSAIGGIWNGLKTVVKTPINAVIGIINEFIGGLNKLKFPDWVPGLGGEGVAIKTIPYLEEGAVLERGQTGFLEGNGAEAVVPLHQNKKWISAVAQDMAESGIGGSASDEMLEAFLAFVAELPAILAAAFGNTKISVNNREFARLVKEVG